MTVSVAGIAPLNLPLMNVDYSLAMHTPGTVQITSGTAVTVILDMATIPANTPMPDGASLSCLLPLTFQQPYCSLSRPAGLGGGFPGLDIGNTNATITLTILPPGSRLILSLVFQWESLALYSHCRNGYTSQYCFLWP